MIFKMLSFTSTREKNKEFTDNSFMSHIHFRKLSFKMTYIRFLKTVKKFNIAQ